MTTESLPQPLQLSADVLSDLYVTQGLSEVAIANRYGLTQPQVGKLRKRWGIPTLTRAERAGGVLPPITPEQHGILIGCLLGNGYMTPLGGGAKLVVRHPINEEGYIRWKAEMLGPYVKQEVHEVRSKKNGRLYCSFQMATRGCPQLRPYYDQFYPAGVLVVPPSLELDPMSLAVWFLDRGGITLTGDPRISVDKSPDQSTMNVLSQACHKLGLYPQFQENSSGAHIQFPEQANHFLGTLQNAVPSCMLGRMPDTSVVASPITQIEAQRLYGVVTKVSPTNHGAPARRGLTEETLRDLYATKTDIEIGALYGVSGVAIAYHRKKWGIPSAHHRVGAPVGCLPVEELTPVILADLYQQAGDRTIAKLYGVTKPTIRNRRLGWGIRSISKSDRATKHTEWTEEQKETLIGTLLGDAHVTERGKCRLTHTHYQLTYLRRIHSILTPHALPIFYGEKKMPNGTLAFTFGFLTVQHVWLKEMRELFYPDGVKVFPEHVIRSLTPRSLAYWYFDDGHLGDNPSFALGDISKDQAEDVVRWVGERFGLDTYLKPSSIDSSCPQLTIRAATADKFFALVREFVTPDMLHKLPGHHHPMGMLPQVDKGAPEKLSFWDAVKDRCQMWKSLSETDQAGLLVELESHWRKQGFPYHVARPEELHILRDLEERHILQDGCLKRRQVGQASCQAFSTHIWKARSYGSTMSPWDLFQDEGMLRKVLASILSSGDMPTAANLRGRLRFYWRSGVYNFRPSAAKVLVDRFCPPGGTLWDPCAGYGGRLLGSTMSKSMPKYIACEPQSETFTRLHHLRDWVNSYGIGAQVELHNLPAEDFDVTPQSLDMVLTSPPYWCREVYGTEPTQSSVRYPTYEKWLKGFWGPVIQKAVYGLKQGGWLVLNVDDFFIEKVQYPLIEDTKRLVAQAGLGNPREILKYAMPTPTQPDNHELVLCWVSIGAGVNTGIPTVGHTMPAPPVPSELVPSEGGVPEGILVPVISRCQKCGGSIPSGDLVGGYCAPCRLAGPHCMDCGLALEGPDREGRRCRICKLRVDAERAKQKRDAVRVITPVSQARTFVCLTCHKPWETEAPGRFTKCPTCKQVKEIQQKTKQCAYRNCGKDFIDLSSKNCSKFCTPECGRREKMFRSGKAKDESYFRADRTTGNRTCILCKEGFVLGEGEMVNRCPTCRDKARSKACRGCGSTYRDDSENNTRRYCDGCQNGAPKVKDVPKSVTLQEDPDSSVLDLFS